MAVPLRQGGGNDDRRARLLRPTKRGVKLYESIRPFGQASGPRILAPLPARDLQWFIDSCSSLLVVEVSYSAQFTQHLRTQVDLPRARTKVYSRSGGKALAASEVEAELRRLLVNHVQEVLA